MGRRFVALLAKLLFLSLLPLSWLSMPTAAAAQPSPYCRDLASGDGYREALCMVGERAAYERLIRLPVGQYARSESRCLSHDLRSWALLEQCIQLEERVGRTSRPAASSTSQTSRPQARGLDAKQWENLLTEVDRRIDERVRLMRAAPPSAVPAPPVPASASAAASGDAAASRGAGLQRTGEAP